VICKLSKADISHVMKVCLVSVNQSDLNFADISGFLERYESNSFSIISYLLEYVFILSTHTKLSNKSGDKEELDQLICSIAFANNGWKSQLLSNHSFHV
jgi:hypothetical protein